MVKFPIRLAIAVTGPTRARHAASHTHLRQTDEWNKFYQIRLAVTQPTRARHAASHTHLRQTDEWNKFYPIRLAVTQPTDTLVLAGNRTFN